MTNEANILSFDEARASVSSRPRRAYASYASKAPVRDYSRRQNQAEQTRGRHASSDLRQNKMDQIPERHASSCRQSQRSQASGRRVPADRRQMGAYSEDAERRREMRRYDRTHASNERSRSRTAATKQNDSLVSEVRHKLRSSKAERQFDRTIGREETSRSKQEQSGSRAAVYEMKMGREHRRSAQMQERSGKARASSGGGVADLFARCNFMRVGAMVLLLFGALALFVYEPAANWYNETRSLQQLQAQYELTAENYNHVKADVDYLSTEEGMADYAHQQLGWVRSGEHSVTVKGLSSESQDTSATTSVTQALSQGSVQAKTPDTWYSGVLDVVFGYADGN